MSVIDAQLDELAAFRARLGGLERSKLDLHLEALRDVEKRIKNPTGGTGGGGGSGGTRPTCAPGIDVAGLSDSNLYDPALFPTTLRAQIDLTVQAMACGLTRVGVVQASHHTSELIMSRFAGTDLYDPNYDMRSHQASHYGASHNPAQKEFVEYGKQVRFWTSQLAYLLEQLRARPEDDGTMLDHSIVLFCTEVCDGNTHLHDDMPFVLAGRASGQIATGRLLDAGGRRHADLLVSIARAMGHPIDHFGDVCGGPLPGLTSA